MCVAPGPFSVKYTRTQKKPCSSVFVTVTRRYPQRLLMFCMLTPKFLLLAPFLHEGGCRKPITNYLYIISYYLHIFTNYLHIITNYMHKISHYFCL